MSRCVKMDFIRMVRIEISDLRIVRQRILVEDLNYVRMVVLFSKIVRLSVLRELTGSVTMRLLKIVEVMLITGHCYLWKGVMPMWK